MGKLLDGIEGKEIATETRSVFSDEDVGLDAIESVLIQLANPIITALLLSS